MGFLTDREMDDMIDRLVTEQYPGRPQAGDEAARLVARWHDLDGIDRAHDERLRDAVNERRNFRRSRAGRDERRKRAERQ